MGATWELDDDSEDDGESGLLAILLLSLISCKSLLLLTGGEAVMAGAEGCQWADLREGGAFCGGNGTDLREKGQVGSSNVKRGAVRDGANDEQATTERGRFERKMVVGEKASSHWMEGSDACRNERGRFGISAVDI